MLACCEITKIMFDKEFEKQVEEILTLLHLMGEESFFYVDDYVLLSTKEEEELSEIKNYYGLKMELNSMVKGAALWLPLVNEHPTTTKNTIKPLWPVLGTTALHEWEFRFQSNFTLYFSVYSFEWF
uniref:Uncharacterized protein n=1 Tax=Graphocephala atropunctata TaxID=36148 RepID=A0A1B6LLW2_9HEMI